MAKILEMPKLSPTMEEGVLAAWHKKEGDAIAVDDLLAEVETDKATMEFRAFDKGTLLKLLVQAGAKVLLGQPVAILGEAGEDVSALLAKAGGGAAGGAQAPSPAAPPAPPTPPSPQAQPAPQAQAAPQAQRGAASPTLTPGAMPGPRSKVTEGSLLDRTAREASEPKRGGDGRVMASPYVRKAAREMGIDLQGATGSGPGGRVVASDLVTMKPGKAGAASTALARPTNGVVAKAEPRLAEPEVRPLSMMRKTIARRLTESKQTVPHFYLTIDVDASGLSALREQINHELAQPERKNGGEEARPLKVSLNDLLVKACAIALLRVPECNASFSPEAILVHRRVDISVAVAIPDGLVTPVVRNADQKSIVAIAAEVRELAARARAKKLKPEEMQDGTFSISNLGMFGIDEFAAVINPPEGAILAVGQVRDVPVVKDGQVVAGKKLAMTLSCDHRVVDGAVGAAFLAELRALLEHPMRILTG
ncbi:MAG TPA: pyruvate dehydrogenase complex dihydrolipoamide acetyltransferase [Polyangiaceae bacterium]|jgi:pyruvate dehydrogenase E2 component (dihydrolipoamide acetyltransferase)